MTNTLIAGGAGFIGSHLTEELLKKGHEITIVDSLITGNKNNIKEFENKIIFIQADIAKDTSEFENEKFDFIYNLASPASPIDYQEKPIDTMMANSNGVKNLLDITKKNNSRFFLASTSEVYGNPLEHPQKETYFGNVNSFGPRSCYDESKRFGEALAYIYKTEFNIETRVARIFNTYGPKMRSNDGRVVPNFITQSLNNEALTIFGNGKQTRSFCYVSDLVAGIIALTESNYSNSPVNLGNPTERTVLDLAKTIDELTENSSKTVFKPLPKDDPTRRKPDITLAKKELNWEPKVELKDGLKETIEWFKKN